MSVLVDWRCMPCPHHRSDEDRGIDRREFMKPALAIGGTSALAAAKARAHDDAPHGTPAPGTDDPDSLPDRQYAWNDFLAKTDVTDLTKTPKHHLQFMLDYVGDGTPTEDEREQVETALRTLERACEWSNEGLVFTLGYSPSDFDRFDEDLPEGTGLLRPERMIEEADIARSGDIEVDDYDAHMHLASKHAHVLLEVEEALFGNVDEVNGVQMEATFECVFEKRDRRTGFIGNPHDQWEEHVPGKNPIPEDAADHGVVGHAQKLARAREEDGTPDAPARFPVDRRRPCAHPVYLQPADDPGLHRRAEGDGVRESRRRQTRRVRGKPQGRRHPGVLPGPEPPS